LLRVVDALLLAVICVAPWFLGGRHPLGELVYVALSAGLALAWLSRLWFSSQTIVWRRTAADWLLLGGLAILLLQLTPWPSGVLDLVSPQISKILPLWHSASDSPARLGEWTQASLAPEQTRAALAVYLAHACLFLVTVQRMGSVADVERLLGWIAISAVLLAAVGLAQYLWGNGKFLWIYEHPLRRVDDAVKGPLVNRNHFAHLLALGLGPLVWAVLHAQRVARQRSGDSPRAFGRSAWLYHGSLLALGLVLFAGLMSLSRGGVAMMALATLASLGWLYRCGLVGKRFALSVMGVFAVIGLSLAIHGYQHVASRLDDYTAGSLDELDSYGYRRKLWQADLSGFADFARLGSGAGSHAEVYPLYLDQPWNLNFTHAENGYLQVALETGVPGLALLLAGLTICFVWCRRALRRGASPREAACAAAVAAGLLASTLHSLADFVWYIPACMALTAILAACACRLAQLNVAADAIAQRGSPFAPNENPASRHRPLFSDGTLCHVARPVLAVGLVIVFLSGGWLTYRGTRAALAGLCWDNYLRYAHSPQARNGDQAPDQAVIDNLRTLLAWQPAHARAQLRLATALAQRFNADQQHAENAMPLGQIRDAVMASRAHFRTRDDLNRWLRTAIGPNYAQLDAAMLHARAAVERCPLQGEAYALLAELCFLEGQQTAGKSAYIDQALKVRPHDGEVLAAAGSHAILIGRQKEAIACWSRALRSGPRTVRQLAGQFAAAQLPSASLVELFELDLPAVRLVNERYAQIESSQQRRPLLKHYAALVKRSAAAQPNDLAPWLELQEVHRQLGDLPGRVVALERALAIDPNSYDARFLSAMCLFDAGRWDKAREQLEWCLQRRPGESELQQKLEAAVRAHVAAKPSGKTRSRRVE
jgi:O-antigen ligase